MKVKTWNLRVFGGKNGWLSVWLFMGRKIVYVCYIWCLSILAQEFHFW